MWERKKREKQASDCFSKKFLGTMTVAFAQSPPKCAQCTLIKRSAHHATLEIADQSLTVRPVTAQMVLIADKRTMAEKSEPRQWPAPAFLFPVCNQKFPSNPIGFGSYFSSLYVCFSCMNNKWARKVQRTNPQGFHMFSLLSFFPWHSTVFFSSLNKQIVAWSEKCVYLDLNLMQL